MTPRPTLETDRLTLRAFDMLDADDVQRLAGDPAIADTTLNVPHPYEDGLAEDWIATHQRKFKSLQQLTLAITLKPGGQLIGAIGLEISKRFNRGELGYWMGRDFWGQGYCTEAARAVLEYAFETLRLNRIHACHITRNPASGRVMQKLGMTNEGVFREHVRKNGKFEDTQEYGMIRSEWHPGGDRATPGTPD